MDDKEIVRLFKQGLSKEQLINALYRSLPRKDKVGKTECVRRVEKAIYDGIMGGNLIRLKANRLV